mgnify:CR=1 FL=1
MSFSFLLGILACCISAFVTVNRFGFALEGSWCAVDRIYYDSRYGQLKDSSPRWEGFTQTKEILDDINEFYKNIKELWQTIENNDDYDYYLKKGGNKKFEKSQIWISLEKLKDFKYPITTVKNKELDIFDDFNIIESEFLVDFSYYAKTLKACLKILSMIYYCLLLIAITSAGVSMMFYACLKRQGYLIRFMHVLWNVIRFFMFSFFLYGTAYGIAFLSIRDSIALMQYIFGDTREGESKEPYIGILGGGGEFLKKCLGQESNMLDEEIIIAVKNYFKNIDEVIKNDIENYEYYRKLNTTICNNDKASDNNKDFCYSLNERVKNERFDISFDCGFIRYDLNQLYRALSDASVESRILAALSLCSSFFGAVAVYFYLLVMHHYNNELFFDSGKSIFTGFDGFGGGYKKKMHDKDPAYKKRKLRAEIELTSKNDEQSAYKNVNKNEDEE